MNLDLRVTRLEAESQIRQLVSAYSFAIDNRDLKWLRTLFSADAVVRSADGVMSASGIEEIMELYIGRFSSLGAGAHYMHDLWIHFDENASNRAYGQVSGHAELARNDQMMVAGLRYEDVYEDLGGGWQITNRIINFLYYVEVSEYPGILLTRYRNRAYSDSQVADFPENLPGWGESSETIES